MKCITDPMFNNLDEKQEYIKLQFVQIVIEVGDARLQPFASLAVFCNLVRLAALLQWVSRKVSLNNEHGSTRSLSFFKDVPSPSVQDTIDTSNSILGTLNFDLINWFHKSAPSCYHGGIQNSPSSRNDL